MTANAGKTRHAIAVVGMALRVPGANTPEQFWRNILGKVDSVTRASQESLRGMGVSEKLLAEPNFVPAKPVLPDIEYFDAGFFDMTPFDAERTDPGHRLFLECAADALERAGVVCGPGGPVTGVFAGPAGKDYYDQNLTPLSEEDRTDPAVRMALRLGNHPDYLTARTSFKLGLAGPSVSVNAACATSLLAIHLAAESLRRGECDVALAGGVNIDLPNRAGYIAGVDGMLSTGGVVRPFDASADGTIFGTGVGVVVLKPLEDALKDGNHIHAVLLGTATNNDGAPADKSSFIAPSVRGQKPVILRALNDAGINPQTIGFVEAHGTGTHLGDPIEVRALTEVYRQYTADTGYCALGSVKANVGHLGSAAGVVSFIKTCLALEHRTLPPVTNLDQPHPAIDFPSSPFFLPIQPQVWEAAGHKRRAAVSAFGFGGTNAHLVLEEAPAPAAATASAAGLELLLLSARSERAVERRLRDLHTHLEEHPDISLADTAHTLRLGRRHFGHRMALVVPSLGRGPLTMDGAVSGIADATRPVVFLFPGQGAQRPGMGRGLYESEAVYRENIDLCARLLVPKLDLDIRTLLHPDGQEAESASRVALRQTCYAQPVMFAVCYALARLVMSKGLEPSAMMGHSIGEYVAACIAGTFSLVDALRLVVDRALLMQACEPGTMLAVFLPEAEVRRRLGTLEVAAVNAPGVTVVAGPEGEVAAFAQELTAEGVVHRTLLTSHAFHSRMMEPVLPALRAAIAATERHPPQYPFISNVTGAFITGAEATDPDYWGLHLRHEVRFSDGVATLWNIGRPLFLELGPRLLTNLLGQHGLAEHSVSVLDGPDATEVDERVALLKSIAWLWCRGAAIDWRAFEAGRSPRKVILPTYPFQRQRHWIAPSKEERAAAPVADEQPQPKGHTAEPLKLFGVDWRPRPLAMSETEPANATYLLFMDEMGLGDAIAAHLAAQGNAVLRIQTGDRFAADEPGLVRLRPGNKSDLEKLLMLPGAAKTPLRVLHLSCVTGAAGPHNDIAAYERAVSLGFYTLRALVQAADACGRLDDLSIAAVADGLIALDGESGDTHAEKAVLLGPCRVIPLEIPGLSMRCLDVPRFAAGAVPPWLVEAVLAEVRSKDAASVAALRPHGRYVEVLAPLQKLPVGRMRLRHRGVVLITGGLGGIGLEVAGDLFQTAQARLVLVSRWAPPPRESWEQRAEQGDKIGRTLAKLLSLEAQGAEVLIAVADVADPHGVQDAIAQCLQRFGTLNGVVHAAGTIQDAPALTKGAEQADEVLRAKIRGALALEGLLAHTPLDFFIHFSSVAGQLPALGQFDYSAANSVLDVLARQPVPGHGLRCAIAWDTWSEVGMAMHWRERRMGRLEQQRKLTHPNIQRRSQGAGGTIIYSGLLDPGHDWVLDEHRFDGRAILPGMGILECVRAAFADLMGVTGGIELTDLQFLKPFFVDAVGHELEIVFGEDGGSYHFKVHSLSPERTRVLHSIGRAAVFQLVSADAVPPEPVTAEPARSATSRFSFGPRWNNIAALEADGDRTRVRLRLPAEFHNDLRAYGLHPALLDMALYTPAARFYSSHVAPLAIDSIRIHSSFPAELFVEGNRRVVGGSSTIDVIVRNSEGRMLVEVSGYTMKNLDKEGFGGSDAPVEAKLRLSRVGDFTSLTLDPGPAPRPGPGEVQIAVRAAGLNFRDVLSALGQGFGTNDGVSGSECSGVISAVGEGVSHLRPGDAVMAYASGAFATHVVTRADFAVRLPSRVSFAEAAGLPIVFMTADYGLNHLARIERGERVLIHAATGGVGLAAIQVARAAGAEVFATAGSEEKRDYLRSIGIEHVMDSRSLGFAEEILAHTNGEGVDVVLNSLAGEFIRRGLEVLRPFGRFVEIGKRDIYTDASLGLLPFSKNLSYFAFDLGLVGAARRPVLANLLKALAARMESGEFSPLPVMTVPIEDAARGFEHLARARHIGKVVFTVGRQTDPANWDLTPEERYKALYGAAISVAEGLQMFRHILSSDETPSHLIVAPRRLTSENSLPKTGGLASERARRGLSTAYVPPSGAEEVLLVRLWQDMLGVNSVGIDDDFTALGGNSITALQILYGVRREFGLRLPATAVFENPTVAKLALAIRETRANTETSGTEGVERLAKKLAALDSQTAARLLRETTG